ncbi:MAG: calcium-binding protein, partial [Selenomonadaceae bacterium]|nr:calcium-binding protein [Selenomonadaceae bacterium]
DGKSISYTPNSNKTLATVSGVKSVSGISLNGKVINVPAAVLNGTKVTVSDGYTLATNGTAPTTKAAWSLNGTNANYVQTTTAGYTLSSDGKSISYTPNSSKTLATVKGVKSTKGLSISGKVITVAKSSLNATKITVGNGYTLALASDVTKPSTKNAWSSSGTTATYKQTKSAGYTLASNAKSIAYNKKSTTTLATVKGVKSTKGLSVSGKVITVAKASLNAAKITVSSGYTLALASDASKPTTKKAAWNLSGTTATYKSSYKTAGYTLASNKKSIAYSKATTAKNLATVKGAKSKSIPVSGKRITLKNSLLTKKVTVSGGYEYDFAADYKNATITGSSSADTIIACGSKVSVNGGKGDDTIKILGAGTVKGGAGADIFYYKSSGKNVISDYAAEDKISIASGKAATSTSGDDLVLTVGKGKITVVGGKSKTVTYIDAGGEHIYKDTADGVKFNAAGTGVTLTADYSESVFDLTDYPDYKNKVVTINAAKVNNELKIIANKKGNTITGSKDDDYIEGREGADLIKGGNGNDTIDGGKNNDKIYGGAGDDSLWGGAGSDTLYGGEGEDIFLYRDGDGNDVIADFELGDKIQVIAKDIGAPTAAKGDVTFKVGDGKIVIKGGADKYIQLYGENGGELSQRYKP